MFNFNHTLRFFGLCFGLFLVLVFSACEKENNKPNSSLSDGSFVELTYKGQKYRMDAFGITGTHDTIFTNPITGEIISYEIFVASVADIHTQQAEGIKQFGVLIRNYNGEGEYEYMDNLLDFTASDILSALYADVPNGVIFHFAGGLVKITKDNTNELSGTFNLEVSIGPDGTNSPAIPCAGKFKIIKR